MALARELTGRHWRLPSRWWRASLSSSPCGDRASPANTCFTRRRCKHQPPTPITAAPGILARRNAATAITAAPCTMSARCAAWRRAVASVGVAAAVSRRQGNPLNCAPVSARRDRPQIASRIAAGPSISTHSVDSKTRPEARRATARHPGHCTHGQPRVPESQSWRHGADPRWRHHNVTLRP